MDIDTNKIDEAVLALLQLTLQDEFRAWKGHDWDALDNRRRSAGLDAVGRSFGPHGRGTAMSWGANRPVAASVWQAAQLLRR